MPVVINEFEVLAEPAPVQPALASSQDDNARAPAKLEPQQIAPALARIAERAMRVWAH